MGKQQGFTLIELMIVIGIIAILSATGIPAYQNYLRKAALTDMLQTFLPLRTAVELCALDQGGIAGCNSGSHGIPERQSSRYVSALSISNGVITLTGQESLTGLTVTMTPRWSNSDGLSSWQRQCRAGSDSALQQACENVFRYNDGGTPPPAEGAGA
ncbi:prepilin peptidase-dependent pilin [Shimwellia blattae]|uniref:Prelipin peptidase dependent protein n=1 Tax=Shimwellia blattae (strain ATCC 29907 / DSM 4481 / JCM 1650 / NBRC 105725 / CDC 9005-74) TaxID=630626 RepID=I2BCQ9_SHIBC|nr:prepilin peptidase-dependent pilin [Shimwellia blattae]AFJ48313.1 prelipin peptidase dependent protein [Shimwellia blattae DSM 4481 = NBRC 105725]GAB81007.1 type IV pilin [Shimwellia blattae DSM 4481 = NBRC 105725]VDY65808.1 Pilin [Shimwellia blattae]VEC25848.1 Pilin [Shimwellia blattae]